MSTALAILDDIQPLAVLTDDAQYSEFYKKIKAEIAAFVPDLSTDKSRAEIKSLAYKVTRTKTAIDEAGKKLNEDGRAKINAVDAQRRKIRDEFDALAIEVRKPLTDWEDAEKKRAEAVLTTMTAISALSTATYGSADDFRFRLETLRVATIDPAIHLEDTVLHTERLNAAIETVTIAWNAAIQREADAAELARLRKAEQDRIAEETARVGRELVAQRGREEAARLARLAETRKEIEAEEAKDREAEIARAATVAAEEKYKREIEAAQAESRAVAERAERAEKERLAAIEKTRVEEENRAADRKHRTSVIGLAAAAIERAGALGESAHRIAVAIADGQIPNVTMRF